MTRLGIVVALVAGCGGGIGSWSATDARKASEIVIEEHATLALCRDDGGVCTASQVRALGEVIECKAASMLFVHGEPIPLDAGAECSQ